MLYASIAVGFVVVWAMLIFIAGLTTVKEGHVKVVFRFGKAVRVLQPQALPQLVIPFIERVEQYSTQTRQFELPDEPEKIDRENNNPLPGLSRPFRVNHKGAEEAEFYVRKDFDPANPQGNPFDNTQPLAEMKKVRFSQLPAANQEAIRADSLNAPLTSEIPVIFEWHLKSDDEKSVFDFIRNVSPEAGRNRTGEVRKRANDMARRVLTDLLGPMTLGHTIYMLPVLHPLIKERLEVLVGEKPDPITGEIEKPWGIHVGDAYMGEVYSGKTVNKARADAAAAVSDKQTTIRNAEAAARKTELENTATASGIRMKADAEAHAEKKKGEGERDRLNAVAEAMQTQEGQFAAALDVAETALTNANVVFAPSDVGVVGSILTLGQNLSKPKNP